MYESSILTVVALTALQYATEGFGFAVGALLPALLFFYLRDKIAAAAYRRALEDQADYLSQFSGTGSDAPQDDANSANRS